MVARRKRTKGSASDEDRYRYIRFSIVPAISEPLFLKKTFEDALKQAFGISRAGMYIDTVWISEKKNNSKGDQLEVQVVVRVAEEDAQALLGAVVTVTKARISLVGQDGVLSKVMGEDELELVSVSVSEE